jgi:hypothetical protein
MGRAPDRIAQQAFAPIGDLAIGTDNAMQAACFRPSAAAVASRRCERHDLVCGIEKSLDLGLVDERSLGWRVLERISRTHPLVGLVRLRVYAIRHEVAAGGQYVDPVPRARRSDVAFGTDAAGGTTVNKQQLGRTTDANERGKAEILKRKRHHATR